jgi:hypothetical protein
MSLSVLTKRGGLKTSSQTLNNFKFHKNYNWLAYSSSSSSAYSFRIHIGNPPSYDDLVNCWLQQTAALGPLIDFIRQWRPTVCVFPWLNYIPLEHECTTLLYKSLIRPIITYSSPVWFGTTNKILTNYKGFLVYTNHTNTLRKLTHQQE